MSKPLTTWTDEQAADATIFVLSEDFTVSTLRSWFMPDPKQTKPGMSEWVSRADHATGMLQVGRALLDLRAALADAEEKECARWQARFEFLHSEFGVDGSFCDSGDPLDFTESEVRQVIVKLTDRATAAEAKLAEWKNGAVNDACGDALELLWRDVIIAHKPDYGPWEYHAQAYRHLLSEFNDLKAKLADERKHADHLALKLAQACGAYKHAHDCGRKRSDCMMCEMKAARANHAARRAGKAVEPEEGKR